MFQWLTELVVPAGVENPNPRFQHLNPHIFRHSIARFLKSKGFTAKWIQNFLGHQSYKTTMDMYGTISIDEMQEVAVKKLGEVRQGCPRRLESLLGRSRSGDVVIMPRREPVSRSMGQLAPGQPVLSFRHHKVTLVRGHPWLYHLQHRVESPIPGSAEGFVVLGTQCGSMGSVECTASVRVS